jgi:hypothetical protein
MEAKKVVSKKPDGRHNNTGRPTKKNDENTQDRYDAIVKDVMSLKAERGSKYRIEPRTIVPIEVLEGQVYLKAVRGYEKKTPEDKIEEYRDCINYCAFVIERLSRVGHV